MKGLTLGLAVGALLLVACGKKKAPEGPGPEIAQPGATATGPEGNTAAEPVAEKTQAKVKQAPSRLSCSTKDGGPVGGPDCVTAEIRCGETVVGHTKGGVQLYDTRFYESRTCWPATRNHNGGDERIYRFVADESPRFQRGETRQRVTVTFTSPCADLTFTKMVGPLDHCPVGSEARLCDSLNPFTRKNGSNAMNITVDAGEVYYFLVEGADDEEGAFSIHLECGT